MRKLFIAITLLFAVSSLSATQTVKSDAIGKFKAVSVSGLLDVKLIQSDENKMVVRLTDEVDISKFKWGVEKETISFQLRGKGEGEIELHYTDPLEKLEIYNGKIIAQHTLVGSYISVLVSGGARFEGDFNTLEADLEITSNSTLVATGETKYLTLRATEKSIVDTRELDAMSADVLTATRAEAYIWVEERLLVNARSSSTIFYVGDPVILRDATSRMSSGMMGSSVIQIGK